MEKAKIISKNGKQVIDFPCPKFKQYLLGNFDEDGDGEISLEEAKYIDYIILWHCTKKSIPPYNDPPLGFPIEVESLAGIEYFKNLQGLGCSDSKIKGHLDLSGNNRLGSVVCNGNEITELTLGKQRKLTCLYCENNQIKELDTSCTPKLTFLHCSNNFLKELDLSSNPVLEELDCSNNRIKYLDVACCPDLKYLDFKNNVKSFRLKILKTHNLKTRQAFLDDDTLSVGMVAEEKM